jgi:hypothetical protein
MKTRPIMLSTPTFTPSRLVKTREPVPGTPGG